MTAKLFVALYVGLIVGMFILFITNFALGWIFFAFVFIAVFGGIYLMDRPYWIAAGFLLTSLIVLILGLTPKPRSWEEWITIFIGGSMSALSAFTLFHVRNFKPAPHVTAPTAAPRPRTRAKTPSPTPTTSSRGTASQESSMEALQCPACGSAELEGSYPEYRCVYCGTRFVDTQELNRRSSSGG